MNNKSASIFQQIIEMHEKHPGTPYPFQDAQVAGSTSVSYFFFHDSLPGYEKDKLTFELIDEIVRIPEGDVLSGISDRLTESAHYIYAERLVRRMKTMLDEGILDQQKIYVLGMRLAKESEDVPAVALGMLLLSYFENDVSLSILRTLGLHSEFTLYALIATQNWKNANAFAYELAKNTYGYGKLAALNFFMPVAEEQQRWMFQNAADNCVLQNMSAIRCLTDADVQKYLEDERVTESNYKFYSRNFAYVFEESKLDGFPIQPSLISEYLDAGTRYAHSFIDFAAIVSIKQSVSPTQTAGISSEIYNKCYELLKQKKWVNILLEELAHPHESSSLIIKTIKEYESCNIANPLYLHFEHFIPILDDDPFDMNVMEYMLLDEMNAYRNWKEIFEPFSQNIPASIFEGGPRIFEEGELSPANKPDIWLIYLLKAMARAKAKEEAFYIKFLGAAFQDVRKEAISALRAIKPEWSVGVPVLLEKKLDTEPDENVKKRIRRLLGLSSGNGKKEQRYVDINDVAAKPKDADRLLLETTIAGAFYRDMSVVEGQLSSGDILYLKPEPDNKYDNNAILVTAEDGYVLGYIPRDENTPLVNRINNGEKLYGILCDEIEHYGGRPFIEIWISSNVESSGTNIIPFSLYQNRKL